VALLPPRARAISSPTEEDASGNPSSLQGLTDESQILPSVLASGIRLAYQNGVVFHAAVNAAFAPRRKDVVN
jgi:hypothetical protein